MPWRRFSFSMLLPVLQFVLLWCTSCLMLYHGSFLGIKLKFRNTRYINKLIRDNIEVGSTIYTDSWRGYSDLSKDYNHEFVDHSKREYVRGNVHTNTIENIWGQFKRNIRKAHIKITDKYVQLYVNEACWRHNNRGRNKMELFNEVLKSTFSCPSHSSKKGIKLFRGAKVSMVYPPSNLVAV